MKKFLFIAVAAACCMAFTVPAMARIDMGGMVTIDAYYYDASKEAVAGGVREGTTTTADSLGRTFIDPYQPLNRIWMRYKSDDGNIGGYIQIRGGGANRASGLDWYYAWIDWHFNPNFFLRIGRQTQTFAILAPPIGVGASIAPSLLFGFGNVHGGSSRDAIRAYIKFNDMARMEINMIDPDNDPGQENVIPRFDISLPLKIANFDIEPSASWLRQEFASVPTGSDDSYDIWGVALDLQAGFGPLLFKGEFTYGQNLGSGNYVGTNPGGASLVPYNGSGAVQTYTTGGNTLIEDTDVLAFWAAIGVKFGPSTLWGVFGYENHQNDGNPNVPLASDSKQYDITRMAYGMRLDVTAAKGFHVIPEICYYDNDGGADIGGSAASMDLGNELMAGVRFQLSF